MPERPGGKAMPVGGSGATYDRTPSQGGHHPPARPTGSGSTITRNGTKGTVSTGTKNVALLASLAKGNWAGAGVNILSRIGGKKKSKPPKGHPETIAKSRIKRPPPIDRGGDGMGGTQMAATSAQAAQPIKPKIQPYKPYYMGFDFQKPINTATHRPLPMKRGGLSGGERFGPPPKKGPDPHGKCPFRPDGIRGVGAVEKGRGVKFIGTK